MKNIVSSAVMVLALLGEAVLGIPKTPRMVYQRLVSRDTNVTVAGAHIVGLREQNNTDYTKYFGFKDA